MCVHKNDFIRTSYSSYSKENEHAKDTSERFPFQFRWSYHVLSLKGLSLYRAREEIASCPLKPYTAGGCDGFLQGCLCSCNRHGFGTTDPCWMVGLCTIPWASWQFLGRRGNHFILTRRVGGLSGIPPPATDQDGV